MDIRREEAQMNSKLISLRFTVPLFLLLLQSIVPLADA
jgi:hypothetical protein